MTRGIKILLAILLVVMLFLLVDLSDLKAVLQKLSVTAFVALMLISFLLVYISALKWGMFIEELGERVSAIKLSGLYLVGYFVNLLMPSYLGGDLVRSFLVGKKIGQHEALAATVLERFTGLSAMVALALFFMWLVPGVGWEVQSAIICLALGLAAIVTVCLADAPLRWLRNFKVFSRLVGSIEKLQISFILVKSNPDLLLRAMLLSLLFHTFTVVNTVATGMAIGWTNPPFLELFVVLPIILIVAALPLTPQGIGVQEGAFYFFLQLVGATPEQALSIALVLRAKTYVLALCGGLIFLCQRGAFQSVRSSQP